MNVIWVLLALNFSSCRHGKDTKRHRPDMEWIQTRHKCTQKRNRTEKNRHSRDKEETRKEQGREMKYKQIKQGADTEWTQNGYVTDKKQTQKIHAMDME